jgi:hypothetical protein
MKDVEKKKGNKIRKQSELWPFHRNCLVPDNLDLKSEVSLPKFCMHS